MTDSPAFYEERIRLLQAENQEAQEMLAAEQRNGNDLLAENQRLRDALEDFANPQHWGMTRDYGPERVPVWIGSYRQSPVEMARSVLDGTLSKATTT